MNGHLKKWAGRTIKLEIYGREDQQGKGQWGDQDFDGLTRSRQIKEVWEQIQRLSEASSLRVEGFLARLKSTWSNVFTRDGIAFTPRGKTRAYYAPFVI